ncbi:MULTISPECIES: glycoside hydrolase family 43 protein [Asticcacaulis]|uniref:glycoside hydrolase family 43 protein n=1 Tax=Asticcacaulis TaxID=76890 RepID=UPI001AE151FC|nr:MULTISPECIES: glycoside hydrolase family 43 protein [Asticcacaulis]MBP2158110.1 beta-xylosidase [Asticcacaulis solisilvae]MDR6799155.1 beta-xylosidase [Asticcacaulis sp. BE141]
MTALRTYAFLLALAAAPAVARDDAPGSNPIIRDVFSADPAALVVGDRVYLYVGRDVSDDNKYRMPDWLAYSSADMTHWQSHGTVLKPTDFKWARSDAYASQVVEKDGKFYFYATAKHNAPDTAMAIGVAVADSPTGPFTDARGTALITNAMTPEAKHDWSDIDPTVFTDDDGTSWLMWGNEKCFIVKLKANMIELDGPVREVALPHYTEGPWLHKRGGLYYVTYASWDKGDDGEYISYATAPSVQGPWTYRGQLTGKAENSSTIHPAIIDFKGQSYFFYHDGGWTIGDKKGGSYRRAVRVERLYYNADGTIRPIVQTKAGVSAPAE